MRFIILSQLEMASGLKTAGPPLLSFYVNGRKTGASQTVANPNQVTAFAVDVDVLPLAGHVPVRAPQTATWELKCRLRSGPRPPGQDGGLAATGCPSVAGNGLPIVPSASRV